MIIIEYWNNGYVPAAARKVLNFFRLDRSYIPRYSLGFDVVAVSIVLFYVLMEAYTRVFFVFDF